MSPWTFLGVGILAAAGATVGWFVGTLALLLRDYDDIDWGDDEF